MTCDLCHEPASRLHQSLVRPDVPRPWDDLPGVDAGYVEALSLSVNSGSEGGAPAAGTRRIRGHSDRDDSDSSSPARRRSASALSRSPRPSRAPARDR